MSNAYSRREELEAIQRHDFYAFVQGAFYAIYGRERSFYENVCLEYLCHRLGDFKEGQKQRLLLAMPPRHLKSFVVSTCLPAWLLGYNPKLEIIVISYNETIAAKLGGDCLNLMTSEFYKNLFPDFSIDPNRYAKTDFATRAGGFRFATSIEGTITGIGADLIIFDDPMKAMDVHVEASRERVYTFLREGALTRFNFKARSQAIVVMQRLHQEDLIGMLRYEADWEMLSFPAIAERDEIYQLGPNYQLKRPKGEPICAEHESLETLEKTKAELGEQVFAAHYQQRPLAQTGSFFKPSDFPTYDPDEVFWPTPRIIISVDTANKTGFHNDNTAIVITKVLGDYAESQFSVCEIIVRKLELGQLLELIEHLSEKYRRQGTVSVVIEDAGIGFTLIDMLKKRGKLRNISPFTPKESKEIRVYKCLSFFHNGQVRFARSALWFERFLNEALSFPDGKHDDQVDALIQAIYYRGLTPRPRIRQL